jgi:hypothetical protein
MEAILQLRDTFVKRINFMIRPIGKEIVMARRGITLEACTPGEAKPLFSHLTTSNNRKVGGIYMGRFVQLLDYLGEFGKKSGRWAHQKIILDRLQNPSKMSPDHEVDVINVTAHRLTEAEVEMKRIRDLLVDIFPDISLKIDTNLTLIVTI